MTLTWQIFWRNLTPRRRAVAECFADGLSQVQTARVLGICPQRVWELKRTLARHYRWSEIQARAQNELL